MKRSGLVLCSLCALLSSPGLAAVPDASGWTAPRHFHTPFDPAFSGRIAITRMTPATAAPDNTVPSPDGACWFAAPTPGGHDVALQIGTDHGRLRILFKDTYPNFSPDVKWVNEKLLFIRVWWGRVLGTDCLIDVENGKTIHLEMVHDGTALFRQSQEARRQTTVDR